MAGAKQVAIPNRLLRALPRKEYQKLLPLLEPVELAFGEILYESHDQIRHGYFPNDCFVSMLPTVDAGRAAEVGLIGPEGMIGVPMALGVAVSPFRAVVQGSGMAMRLKTGDFRRNFSNSAALKREVFLFTHLLMIQIAQTAACNRFHVVTQRMAVKGCNMRKIELVLYGRNDGQIPTTYWLGQIGVGMGNDKLVQQGKWAGRRGVQEYPDALVYALDTSADPRLQYLWRINDEILLVLDQC